ncbi:MAG: DUF2207 domain-containing protein [Candidatus Paceibacterota bacterium]|jgi:hypothetical protein
MEKTLSVGLKNFIRRAAFFAAALALFLPLLCQARDQRTLNDWYIKDFHSQITVNKDSSLLIQEDIAADCGNLPDKHGIFRIVPTQTNAGDKQVRTPVKLVSITDFDGTPLKYSASEDKFNHTITWKIGDPGRTVKGENDYRIIYSVQNAVRSDRQDADEFYWNLSGNFWEIPIDKFSADIILPEEIDKSVPIDHYAGSLGSKGKTGLDYVWTGDHSVRLSYSGILDPGEGATVSISFPKNIFTPYQFSFFELYGDYLWLFLPLLAFAACYRIWLKYGKDPGRDKAITPEFEVPGGLSPAVLGALAANGNGVSLEQTFTAATIVNLAVNKYITIEETSQKGIFGTASKDYKLKKIRAEDEFSRLDVLEKFIADALFKDGGEILLSSLKLKLEGRLMNLNKIASGHLVSNGWVVPSGQKVGLVLLLVSILMFGGGIFLGVRYDSLMLGSSAVASAIIIFIFAVLMPKRTPMGAELNWRIKGLKMYMQKAEKYRQQFYEKENIFEKLLPYAIVLGMTGAWIKKVEEIYGKEYFSAYHPVWYIGSGNSIFNADSFSSSMDSLSSQIASVAGTSSGAGGGGGSGGGGGGGGGGGW